MVKSTLFLHPQSDLLGDLHRGNDLDVGRRFEGNFVVYELFFEF